MGHSARRSRKTEANREKKRESQDEPNVNTSNAHGTGGDHSSPVRPFQGRYTLYGGSPFLSTLPLLSVTSVKLAVLPDRWPCCWIRVDRSNEVRAVVSDFVRFPNSWRPVLCVPFVSPRRTIRRCTLLVLLSSAVESLRPV